MSQFFEEMTLFASTTKSPLFALAEGENLESMTVVKEVSCSFARLERIVLHDVEIDRCIHDADFPDHSATAVRVVWT